MYPVVMKNVFIVSARQFQAKGEVQNYATSLFDSLDWVYPLDSQNIKEHEKAQSDLVNKTSEKSMVLSEFEDFSKQKLHESNDAKISFEGGEIHTKVMGKQLGHEQLVTNLSQVLSTHLLQRRFNLNSEGYCKLQNSDKVKIMFINDILLDDDFGPQDFGPQDFGPQLRTAFSEEVSELFAKMIRAMRLEQNEFVISGTKIKNSNGKEELERDFLSNLYDEILYFRPQMLITLGALATQSLLQTKERLAKVHGQIFHKKIGNELFDVKIMPLFHPELLLINPNMKKTAWIDMQKAMKELGLV